MNVKIVAAAVVLFSIAAALAQTESNGTGTLSNAHARQVSALGSDAGRPSLAGNRGAAALAPATQRQRVQSLEGTLAKMHALLGQMKAKAARNPKDTFARDNLDLWDLMVTQMDAELKDLKVAMLTREDMEARRAALYKQADAKSQAAAQAAQRGEHAAPPLSGAQAPGDQTSPAPASNASPSPQ